MERGFYQSAKNVFHFKYSEGTPNILTNSRTDMLQVDKKKNIVESNESSGEPLVSRAQNPLDLDQFIAYFQVMVLKATQEDSINVGIVSKDHPNQTLVGQFKDSFGYFKGDIYLQGSKMSFNTFNRKLRTKDRIGIGLNAYLQTFFIALNGQYIQQGIPIPSNYNGYYPAVALRSQGQKVQFLFTTNDYSYKLRENTENLQNLFQSKMNTYSNFTSTHIYSLVHDYLSFNKYTSTLSLMKNKNIEYARLKKYVRNLSITPLIDLNQKEEGPPGGDANIPEVNEIDQPINKCSIASNQSQSMPQKYDQNQQFLQCHRIKIVELIKQRKVKQAYFLMSGTIPDLFQQDYLQAYMKGHIFLSLITENSCMDALNFSKQQKTIFSAHLSTLFPFYNSMHNNIEWRPLKAIFLSMAVNDQKKNGVIIDMLSNAQFESFSSYINDMILKRMGYLSCSRLSYYCSHMKAMKKKLEELRGLACGIELDI